jgi:hypothetical protein
MRTIEYYKEQTTRPGRFEGETPLTVFIWEESLDGALEALADTETDGFWAEKITLTAEEQEFFRTTGIAEWVVVQDSQGFIFSMPFDRFDSYKS